MNYKTCDTKGTDIPTSRRQGYARRQRFAAFLLLTLFISFALTPSRAVGQPDGGQRGLRHRRHQQQREHLAGHQQRRSHHQLAGLLHRGGRTHQIHPAERRQLRPQPRRRRKHVRHLRHPAVQRSRLPHQPQRSHGRGQRPDQHRRVHRLHPRRLQRRLPILRLRRGAASTSWERARQSPEPGHHPGQHRQRLPHRPASRQPGHHQGHAGHGGPLRQQPGLPDHRPARLGQRPGHRHQPAERSPGHGREQQRPHPGRPGRA